MYNVIKKDGTIEPYNEQKIIDACNKAARRAMVNLSDEDYKALGKEIYKTLVVLNKSYGDGAGIKNISDAKSIFKQAKDLAAVNAASSETIETVLSKYYADLGIKADIYKKFTAFSFSLELQVTTMLL